MVYCSPFEAGRRSTIVREFESRPLRHSFCAKVANEIATWFHSVTTFGQSLIRDLWAKNDLKMVPASNAWLNPAGAFWEEVPLRSLAQQQALRSRDFQA